MKLNRCIFALATGVAFAMPSNVAFADKVLDRVMSSGTLTVATDANWASQSSALLQNCHQMASHSQSPAFTHHSFAGYRCLCRFT